MSEGSSEAVGIQATAARNWTEDRVNATGSDTADYSAFVPSRVLDWARLSAIADASSSEYVKARPYPHLMLDDLFDASQLETAIREMPIDNAKWNTYNTVDEYKHVCSDIRKFGPTTETLVHALNSAPFVNFLEKLTGIKALIPDPSMHAAGYMRVEPKGFLALHTDFTAHAYLRLERRINVLVYLNRDWQPEWGGQLELHSNNPATNPKHETITIEPVFNRMVIFNTPNALHGHPRPIACPPGRARLCLSWYYYTAPATLGYWSKVKKVDFVNRRSTAQSKLINLANELLPPIVFRAMQKVRDRYKGPAA